MKDLDRVLDEALSAYVAAPDDALAERVLRRARRRSFGWMYAAAAAAAVFMLVWAMRPREQRVLPQREAATVRTAAVPVIAPPPKARPARRVAKTPAGVPVSRDEQRLAAFVLAHEEVFATAAKELTAGERPLEIAALEVAPLEF
jgi:hypothetical protein